MNVKNYSRAWIVVGSLAAAAIPLSLYYLLREKKTLTHKISILPSASEKVDLYRKISNFQKHSVTIEVASALNSLLLYSEADEKYKLLSMVQLASAFSSNFVVLKDSGCLEAMLSSLVEDTGSGVISQQNLCILQAATNLACDSACLSLIQNRISIVLKIADTNVYSDQACAALQLLCNVALTPHGCRLLDDKLPLLCNMLETKDPHMLRQVFSMLINLSCDKISCALLLDTKVPPHLMDTIIECLSSNTPPQVTTQSLSLLKNLYSALLTTSRIFPPSSNSISEFLEINHPALNLMVQFLLSESIHSDLQEEMKQTAESLSHLIDRFGNERQSAPS